VGNQSNIRIIEGFEYCSELNKKGKLLILLVLKKYIPPPWLINIVWG
jgi:hypothetical protein